MTRLAGNYSSRSRNGKIELKILNQPEEQHRARYLTEGSRGSIKDGSGLGHPVVKLFGFNGCAVKLQCFIGHDKHIGVPHLFYQASRITGKNSTRCSFAKIDGTCVITLDLTPENSMQTTIDCIGILKERNVDVEQKVLRLKSSNGNIYNTNGETVTFPSKKRCAKCRLVFRCKIPGTNEILQAVSTPILCTQPVGTPEICKLSLTEYKVTGGKELYIIGKNFLKDSKVIFKSENWGKIIEPDKEYLHSSHLICTIPAYDGPNAELPGYFTVSISIRSGGKYSDSHVFTYVNESKADSMLLTSLTPLSHCIDTNSNTNPSPNNTNTNNNHNTNPSDNSNTNGLTASLTSSLNGTLNGGGGGGGLGNALPCNLDGTLNGALTGSLNGTLNGLSAGGNLNGPTLNNSPTLNGGNLNASLTSSLSSSLSLSGSISNISTDTNLSLLDTSTNMSSSSNCSNSNLSSHLSQSQIHSSLQTQQVQVQSQQVQLQLQQHQQLVHHHVPSPTNQIPLSVPTTVAVAAVTPLESHGLLNGASNGYPDLMVKLHGYGHLVDHTSNTATGTGNTNPINVTTNTQSVADHQHNPHGPNGLIKQEEPTSVPCWTPSYEVTPVDLITGGYITEYGVYNTPEQSDISNH